MNRRHFLGALGATGSLAAGSADAMAALRELAATPGEPEEVARDEDYWTVFQRAFEVDRAIVNLNNGGVCPAPASVMDALSRRTALANEAPAYKMWRLQEPRKEFVRAHLARHFGVDAEELAITRNASESLQICQFGFDLAPGDEVLCTDQDYPRMLATFRQRERREGIRLVRFPLPTPVDPDAVVRGYAERITPRTRLILVSHMINLTGQVLPVAEVCDLGRARGIPVLVDGAHSFAHFPFLREDLRCDFFATSLHKWLFAPIGTGFLSVRRDRICDVWPLMAAEEHLADDIRKFEQVGTHPVPILLSIAEALTFLELMGPARKAARLVYLRDRWARRFADEPRVVLNTDLAPGRAFGIANVALEGVDAQALQQHLWGDLGLYTITITHCGVHPDGRERGADDPQFVGLRVSPGPYATLEEIDRFGDALERVLREGLPA